jgi:hypothetical protein
MHSVHARAKMGCPSGKKLQKAEIRSNKKPASREIEAGVIN